MKTTYTTRFAALSVAVLISVAINGAVLSGFDAVAQAGVVANSGQTPTNGDIGDIGNGHHRGAQGLIL